jgi:hypothetical protein
VKQALIEPLAEACLLQAYFRKVEGPDPQWDARLDQLPQKFRELKARAMPESKNTPESEEVA